MKKADSILIIILIVVALIAFAVGYLNQKDSKPKKHYPIKVQCFYETPGYQSYPTMDADSVVGNTIYKDGLKIMNNNIVNVTFK